jgi:predicted TIM-barrel fold metal-dependent hydrolase
MYTIHDVHVHVHPFSRMKEEHIRFLMWNSDYGQHGRELERNPEYLVKLMDQQNVGCAVIINYVSPVLGFTTDVNRFAASYVKDYRDRLIPFGGVDFSQDLKEFEGELDEIYSRLELAGIKLHPCHQLIYPNQYLDEYGSMKLPQLEKLYQFASDHGLPITVHTGTSMFPGARNKYGDPLYLDDVLTDFPKLRLIMAHGGRPLWTDRAFFLLRRFKNLYLDISSIPPQRILHYFPRITEIADRVLYGSDWPSPGVKGMRPNAEEILKLEIPQEAKHKIVAKNFEQLSKT